LEKYVSDKKQSPNDQRSNVRNPNNPAHAADQANRERLGQQPPQEHGKPKSKG
jgi:hypothetical protein